MSRHHSPTPNAQHVAALAIMFLIGTFLGTPRADAATITAAYVDGVKDVVINGYGTPAMGTFRLDTGGGRSEVALCVEADAPHSTLSDVYRAVDPRIDSASLDTLIWLIGRRPTVDGDTAVAASALAWFYADAQRNIGVPVWSDGSRAFARIGPLAPEPWDALPRFGVSHPVGLRAAGVDLDAAERRVASLHREVTALRGPWQLTADADGRTVRLFGPGGGIPQQTVQIEVSPTHGTPVRTTVTTDASGSARFVLPPLPDGGTVTLSAEAPGPHREWDGDGRVQRMITATTVSARTSFDVAPLPVHIAVTKRSTDPTIGVEGAVFGLFDADGVEIERISTASDGTARFASIDPIAHRAPYEVREIAAPPGLLRSADVSPVNSPSTDPGAPTIIEVVNPPITVPVRIRKMLSIDDAGPPDRSSFEFNIRRLADGLSWDVVTAADGHTPPLPLPLGTYEVCEVGTPAWATGLIDGGCVAFTVDLSALATGVGLAFDYVNIVPEPLVDTHARDRADGDQVIPTGGGRLVDVVELARLIPGTTYTVTGTLFFAADGSAHLEQVETAGAATFVADSDEHTIEVEFDVAAARPGTIVITERVSIGDTTLVDHADLDDLDQTITVVAPPTTTTTTSSTIVTTTSTTTSPTTSTTPATPSSTTTTTSTTTSPTTTTSSTVAVPPPTLPRTGGHPAAALLHWGDLGFALGVLLIAATALLPRRSTPGVQ